MQYTFKTKIIAIIIIALLTSSIGTMALANAHTPAWNIPTYAYVSVAPNPAGLGQLVTIGMWVQIPPPTACWNKRRQMARFQSNNHRPRWPK